MDVFKRKRESTLLSISPIRPSRLLASDLHLEDRARYTEHAGGLSPKRSRSLIIRPGLPNRQV